MFAAGFHPEIFRNESGIGHGNVRPAILQILVWRMLVLASYRNQYGSFTWPFRRVHSGERDQRENASKVATHLAVLEGMDKKTGPRYQPRLNILGCFTLVHAFRAGKPQKPRCAMILSTHTGL
jgi:hypothetical protein